MPDWQTLIVAAVVLVAVLGLVQRIRRAWIAPDKSGCGGGCQSCEMGPKSHPSARDNGFVPLDDVLQTVEHRRD